MSIEFDYGQYLDGEFFDVQIHSHGLSDEEIARRALGEPKTSGVHITKPLSGDELEILSKGTNLFTIAMWFCPNCGHLTSIDTEPVDKETRWHKAVSVQHKNIIANVSIY